MQVFEFDFTDIQEADDGNTTHFGGTFTVNGEEQKMFGDDRTFGDGVDDWLSDHFQPGLNTALEGFLAELFQAARCEGKMRLEYGSKGGCFFIKSNVTP